jgi:hypothetical protein
MLQCIFAPNLSQMASTGQRDFDFNRTEGKGSFQWKIDWLLELCVYNVLKADQFLTNNMAEGCSGKRYYGGGGCEIVKIENIAIEKSCVTTQNKINVQPHSGSRRLLRVP